MGTHDTLIDRELRSVDPGRASLVDLASGADSNAPRPPGGAITFEARYEMREEIGRGAMGEVWRCFDRTIGREVAMKLMREELVARPSRWRFVREARVQGQLEHPSIVPLYDLGIAPDGLYFASSWVGRGRVAEGTPLAFELDSSDADVLLYRYSW